MTVSLPPEYQRFVEQLVGRGEYQTADDVVCDSLDLLRAQSAYRQQRLDRVRRDVDAGIEQMKQGRVSSVDPMSLLEELEMEQPSANEDRA
jgi:antitoxin ParD1/3/4